MTRFIIIEGAIGAGKSTLIKHLKESGRLKNTLFIPEYIETPLGQRMLERFIRKDISEEVFQWYILSYWNAKLENIDNYDLVIMERGPVAGYAFTKAINLKERLLEDILLIMNNYNMNFPSHMRWIVNFPANVDFVISMIHATESNAIIYINISDEDALRNIIKRDRTGEKNYEIAYLQGIKNELYSLYFGDPVLKDN